MNGFKRLTLGLVAAAALAVVLIGGLISATGVSAGGTPTVTISTLNMAPGEKGNADLSVLNIGPPGLGAWSITVSYDQGVITVGDCTPHPNSVCNPNNPGSVIVTGANPNGLEGDTVVASINITCGSAPGTTDLTINVSTLADATIGAPAAITHTVVDGSVTCATAPTNTPVPPTNTSVPPTDTPESTAEPTIAPPPTGTSGSSSSAVPTWLIATLAGAGVAAAAGFGALRFSARRS